jgi:hypothetical protein
MTDTDHKARRDPIVRFIIVLGAVCLLIGLVSLFFTLIGRWFFVSVFLTVLVAAGFFWGNRLSGQGTGRSPVFGGALVVLSCLLLFLDVISVNKMLGEPFPSFSYVIFVAALLSFAVAYLTAARLVLVFAVMCLFSWLAYLGGGFWGWLPFFKSEMMSHSYVAAAAPFVILAGFLHRHLPGAKAGRYGAFPPVYYFLGFLFLNISLWMLSSFGMKARLFGAPAGDVQIVVFTILFFIANVATIIFGGMTRGRSFIVLGVIFLTVNVLTRFGDVFVPGLGRSATFIVTGAIVIATGLILETILRKR